MDSAVLFLPMVHGRVRFPAGGHVKKNNYMEKKDLEKMTLEELREAYKDAMSCKDMWARRAQEFEKQVDSLKVVLKMFVQ